MLFSTSLTVCGVLYMDQCSTWSCCCCSPATPKPSSRTRVGNGSPRLNQDGGKRNDTRVNLCNVCWLSRYGASSWHGHRLLGPSLAVVSDERAGESHLRPLIWRVTQFSSEVVHWINFQPKTLFKISLGTLCRLLPRLGKSILQGYQKRYWVFFNTSIVLKFKNLVLWQLQSTQDQNMFRNVQKVFKKAFVWNEKLKLDFSTLHLCFCSKFKNNVIRDFTEIKVEVSTSFWRFCLCFRWEFLLSNTLWKLVIESGIKTEGSYRGVRL